MLTRCPRCGHPLAGEPKFCSNCAFRLKPDLIGVPASELRRATLGQRLVALGGYLAFASLLLVLAIIAIRLFVEPPVPVGLPATEVLVLQSRDRDALPLTRASFRTIEAGRSFWGLYDASNPMNPPEEFFIDEPYDVCLHETTNDQYYAFLLDRVRAGDLPPRATMIPRSWDRPDANPRLPRIYRRGHANHPVTGVDFYASLEFCAWLWQGRFHSDPDLLVDLPTCLEFVRAGRGEQIEDQISSRTLNFSGILEPVNSASACSYNGFFGLLGNAAEWVHGPLPDLEASAAGGSVQAPPLAISEWETRRATPFSLDGFEPVTLNLGNPYVGFRVLLRRAPELPTFVPVEGGSVTTGPAPDRPEFVARVHAGHPEGAGGEAERLHVSPVGNDHCDRAFEITRAEITNRQFLAFLVDIAKEVSREELERLRPRTFPRRNPNYWESQFHLPFGPAEKILYIFRPGEENLPVQGVTLKAAQAYAEWLARRLGDPLRRYTLPSVAQFLRAGRGSASSPYPWGVDAYDRGLICKGRAFDAGRPYSLLGRLGASSPPIVGLAGNVQEYVYDRAGDRWLLAGGCYHLPAAYCTLDSFMEPDAPFVAIEEEEVAEEEEQGTRITAWRPDLVYRGFRVVRAPW
ncbi:MAG: SUMF1/EgtB/PvdO family nonheme iron enzyme [Planctomycetaceae bacterium]